MVGLFWSDSGVKESIGQCDPVLWGSLSCPEHPRISENASCFLLIHLARFSWTNLGTYLDLLSRAWSVSSSCVRYDRESSRDTCVYMCSSTCGKEAIMWPAKQTFFFYNRSDVSVNKYKRAHSKKVLYLTCLMWATLSCWLRRLVAVILRTRLCLPIHCLPGVQRAPNNSAVSHICQSTSQGLALQALAWAASRVPARAMRKA